MNTWQTMDPDNYDGTTFRIDLANGHMLYDLLRDEWVVWSHVVGQCGGIDANKFRTIREFKLLATQMIATAQPRTTPHRRLTCNAVKAAGERNRS